MPRFVKTRIMRSPYPGGFGLLGLIAVLAVGVRLVALNQGFVDRWSWRQSDVAAIARNYSQTGFHFAYPQIDWSGNASGYVGTEFPILPFIAALCYRFLGVHEWIGRSESVLFFALSLPFFAALVCETFGGAAARWALIFYSFAPLSVMTSRCFMPDIPSLSLSIIGLYYFIRWLEKDQWLVFFLSAFAISLALLIKLPSAIIGAPLACAALQRYGGSAFRRPALWLFGLLVLGPSIGWYLHAVHVAKQFYPHHFFGEGGIQLMGFAWYWNIARRIITSSVTIVPLVLAGIGLFLARKIDRAFLFYWWLAAIIVFVLVAGYGNRHPWYQLPLIPIVAMFGGVAMASVWSALGRRSWLKIAITFIILAFGVQSYTALHKLYRPTAADLRTVGLALKEHTPPGSLIVIADYGDPTAFYYGERKGWHFLEKDAIYNGHPSFSADAISDLEHLRQQGATHLVLYS
ncbi:MAG TPA: glycosyltransferase family 39 protein, partial [Chthoniobacterales bacterium]